MWRIGMLGENVCLLMLSQKYYTAVDTISTTFTKINKGQKIIYNISL